MTRRSIYPILFAMLCSAAPVLAAENGHEAPAAVVEHDAHATPAHGEAAADAHGAAGAEHKEEGAHHALPLDAPRLSESLPINNSMVMVWLAVGLIVLFARAATKKMTLVPQGVQNFAEWAVESR
jgi:F-type H+-transporting ATPase subunit a